MSGPRICRTDVAGQLRARRAASWRLPPLACGCRDPWPCRCYGPPPSRRALEARRMTTDYQRRLAAVAQRGKQIAESGKYAPPRGEYLGRIESWGRLDVYEGSPEEWIEALRAEQDS